MKTTVLKQIVVGALLVLSQLTYSNIDPVTNSNKNESMTLDSTICLQLKGRLPKSAYGTHTTFTVELINNNTLMRSVIIKDGGDFNFLLKRNSWYAIKIYGGDAIPKLISICTNVPKESESDFHKLYFEVDDLINFTEAANLESDALDFPLAIFSYDKKFETFNYMEDYSKNIKKDLLATLLPEMVAPKLYCRADKAK